MLKIMTTLIILYKYLITEYVIKVFERWKIFLRNFVILSFSGEEVEL